MPNYEMTDMAKMGKKGSMNKIWKPESRYTNSSLKYSFCANLVHIRVKIG